MEKAKKIKWLKILLGLLLFFFFGCIGLIVTIVQSSHLTPEETREFTATVSHVEVTEHTESISWKIKTQEYNVGFIVYINQLGEEFSDLKVPSEGEQIVFRLENVWAEMVNEEGWLFPVTLETEETVVLSLEQYNESKHQSSVAPIIAAIVLEFLFLWASIKVYLRIRKIERLRITFIRSTDKDI